MDLNIAYIILNVDHIL